jgi:hypothetical protein
MRKKAHYDVSANGGGGVVSADSVTPAILLKRQY